MVCGQALANGTTDTKVYTSFSLTGHPLTGLLANRTDGGPHYPDSPVKGCPVNGNGVHKIWYPEKGESS